MSSFDPKVAAQHGYELRTNTKGQLVTAKVGAPIETGTVLPAGLPGAGETPAAGTVSPMNIVTADCGSSYAWLYNDQNAKYHFSTGFGVTTSAVAYTWRAQVYSGGYIRTWNYNGGLALRRTWEGTGQVYTTNPGKLHTADASGSATLANGVICVSGGPSDQQYIG